MENRHTSFRFCFTLDTEPDNLWEYQPLCTFESFKKLPDFHQMLIDAGAHPTYLTTSEVVESPLGRAALEHCLGLGISEIGAHFHAWTRTWPFELPNLRTPPVMAMAHRLGAQVEEKMLAYTCDVIKNTLGIEVKSYRGGRWSLGPETPQALLNCGITTDSTMTPGLSWRDYTNSLTDGSDYRKTPLYPHYLSNDAANTDYSIVELPVGAAYFPHFGRALFRSQPIRRYVNAMRKMGITLGHRWLRPTETTVKDMRKVMLSLKRHGCAVWVLMIHSSEIIPCTILPSQRDVQALIDRCLGGIKAAIELGAEPATLSEAAIWAKTNDAIICHDWHIYP